MLVLLIGGIYAVEMGSGAIIYTRSFITIGSGIQNLLGGIHRHREQGALIHLMSFFQNKESKLKSNN
jgi:hypothetical protein